MNKTTSKRLLALDILRGITIAGMIMVNNPGSWSYVYAPLGHAQWNGLTPTDLVFPFFMFIMGISTYISLRKYNFEFSHSAALKILKRTIVIFAIGLGLAWFSMFCRTWNSLSAEEISFFSRLGQSIWTFDHIRILGVMQRLALCYGATAIVALTMKHKHIPYLIATLLIGYFILLVTGNGFEYNSTNILSVVDRAVLGEAHMYKDNGIDPEGLLSTIPAIAHVLIGFCVGKLLMEVKDINEKLGRLFLIGTILTFLGFLLSYGCPINKKIWSPTFAIVTCGLGSSFLALLIWIIDVKGYKSWSRFFESFGVNPLFIYVMAGVLAVLLGNIRVSFDGTTTSLHSYIYKGILQPLLGDYPGSLAFALLFVALNWSIGYILYKMMHNALSTHLNTKNGIEVNTDMLAVARGLCGHKPGIACIMGTGSNSCFYDGEKIASNVSPLGFILGDEGSGAVLGKLLVGDMLKNQMTPELKEKFLNKTGLTPPEIIDRVYRQPFPNRFLASLSPFLAENIQEPSVHALVLGSFKAFFQRNVMQYDYKNHPVHFIGSVAYHYQDILHEAARELEIQITTIVKSPMQGLMTFHQS